MQYFSDRELGQQPSTNSEISDTVWQGIAWSIQDRMSDGSFRRTVGEKPWASEKRLSAAIKAEIPALPPSLRINRIANIEKPSDIVVMDIIEFCWGSVGKYKKYDQSYSYYGSARLHEEVLDKDAGQSEFRERINHIFRRNGVAFTLTEQGRIERVIPEPIGNALQRSSFRTEDTQLNDMLEAARQKFLSADETEHRDALEKLWDAWERLKTVHDSVKKVGAEKMLDESAGSSQSQFRALLGDEAKALTVAGNKFGIRHSETNQEHLEVSEHVDYLFLRMFSLIHLILGTTERTG